MGTEKSPQLVLSMDGIIEKVTGLVAQLTEGSPYFLVDMKIKPTQNLKVYLDGDHGINIEACSNINRALYKQIVENGILPDGEFSLEVSSPGLDAPLKHIRQYIANTGREVEVLKQDDTEIVGKLLSADEEKIVVEEEKMVRNGKKKEKVITVHEIPMVDIRSTKVEIEF